MATGPDLAVAPGSSTPHADGDMQAGISRPSPIAHDRPDARRQMARAPGLTLLQRHIARSPVDRLPVSVEEALTARFAWSGPPAMTVPRISR